MEIQVNTIDLQTKPKHTFVTATALHASKIVPVRQNLLALKAAALVAAVSISSASYAAADITLAFASLPTAQGWSYYSDLSLPESSIFSISNGALIMDSTPGNGEYYYMNDAIDTSTATFSLTAQTKIVSGGYTMSFYFGNGSVSGAIYLSPDSILYQTSSGGFQTLASTDNTTSRNYHIQGDFSTSGYSVFVDSFEVGTGDFFPYSINQLIIGDAGSTGSGVAELTAYRFLQPIPEPATVTTLLFGLATIAAVRKRILRSSRRRDA